MNTESKPILQTAADSTEDVAHAVAHRLTISEWARVPTRYREMYDPIRRGLPKHKANKIAHRVVPLTLDHLSRTGSGLVCGPFSREELVVDHVKRSVGMWQYLLWRVAIGIVARWLVEWWLSDRSAAYRGRHCG